MSRADYSHKKSQHKAKYDRKEGYDKCCFKTIGKIMPTALVQKILLEIVDQFVQFSTSCSLSK
jgi:hypothetical protein